jgi:hypothetical protein
MKTQRDILVSVDDVCELDAAVFGFLEMWQDSEYTLDTTLLLGLVVGHEIGVVVATPLP